MLIIFGRCPHMWTRSKIEGQFQILTRGNWQKPYTVQNELPNMCTSRSQMIDLGDTCYNGQCAYINADVTQSCNTIEKAHNTL